MALSRDVLERQLNDFDPAKRQEALESLIGLVKQGAIEWPEPGRAVNLHYHTFHSFNGYGYSPACVAWKARCSGLAAAGTVDFDVLDAVDEFLGACRLLGLRGCAGIETRVYLPEFASREINSPGEPGITYHMGVGFASARSADTVMLAELKRIASSRNRSMMERINAFLDPVTLDYERDVLTLTPSGNATERHLAMAYGIKARQVLSDEAAVLAFWSSKLGVTPEQVQKTLPDEPVFQGLIRSKLMKAGGVGYVRPEGPDFPSLDAVNQFVIHAGAIPAVAWLDGCSEGEQAIDELLDVMMQAGAAALNIIPDRNWNLKDADTRKRKVAELHKIVRIAQERDLPILVGTEMNAYGQRFVDDFGVPEMEPLVEPALEGAHILFAHTALQSHAGMGYLSPWAQSRFTSARAKNAFFAQLGRVLEPSAAGGLAAVTPDSPPELVLAQAKTR